MGEATQAAVRDYASERLLAVARALDAWFRDLPPKKLDAKRFLADKAGFEPAAEVLQAACGIADGTIPAESAARVRDLLALRYAVDIELAALFVPPRPAAATLERTIDLAPRLLDLRDRAAVALEQESDVVRRYGRPLLPDRDELVTAVVLAPRLLVSACAGGPGELLADAPSLTPSEAGLFFRVAAGEPGVSRVCLDAVLLRTRLQDDRTAWESGGGAHLADRLDADRIAYHVVSARLQDDQDAALKARMEELAATIRDVQRSLFAEYRRVLPAIRGAASPAASDDAEVDAEAVAAAQAELIAKCAEAERAAEEIAKSRVSKEEVYLDALQGVSTPSAAPEIRPDQKDLRRERARRRLLLGIAGLCAVIAVAVNLVIWKTGTTAGAPPPMPTPADFESSAPVTAVDGFGDVLHARISRWTWDGLSADQRVRRVDLLASTALKQGYHSMYVSDDAGVELAKWSSTEGVEILDAN